MKNLKFKNKNNISVFHESIFISIMHRHPNKIIVTYFILMCAISIIINYAFCKTESNDFLVATFNFAAYAVIFIITYCYTSDVGIN